MSEEKVHHFNLAEVRKVMVILMNRTVKVVLVVAVAMKKVKVARGSWVTSNLHRKSWATINKSFTILAMIKMEEEEEEGERVRKTRE